MASGLSRRYGARLEQRQVVPVRIGEVGREAVVRLDGCRIFELQPAGFEGLEVLPQIVRLEHPVVATATRLRGRPRIQLVLALEEDHLDVHSLRGDRQPTRVARGSDSPLASRTRAPPCRTSGLGPGRSRRWARVSVFRSRTHSPVIILRNGYSTIRL